MTPRTKAAAITLAGITALAGLTACGPSQEDQDKTAATDVATKFVQASSFDRCRYDADYTTQEAIDRCQSGRTSDAEKKADELSWSVQEVQPWGDGYAVKLKSSYVMVVGLVKIGNDWKVSKDDSASESVAAQSDWACQVIGGPGCGGGK